MSLGYISTIKDIGTYTATLAACLDNLEQLPVPDRLLESYEGSKGSLKPAGFKLPPPLQAICHEEMRLEKELRSLPGEAPLLDQHVLVTRLNAVRAIKMALIKETVLISNISRSISQITIGPEWVVYIAI